MSVHRWEDIKARKLKAEQRERARKKTEEMLLEMNLQELRKAIGRTQEELAAITDMSQSELSKTERREDHLLSTLRRYVEALGGELEVLASFGEKKIRLRGV